MLEMLVLTSAANAVKRPGTSGGLQALLFGP